MMKRATPLIALIAALHGATGVALAAASAHAAPNPLLATASQFLMIHASVEMALAALIHAQPPVARWLAVAAFCLQGGVTLFSADLLARVYGSGRLFPFAAPIGGSLTIVSWLALAVAAALWLARGRDDASM